MLVLVSIAAPDQVNFNNRAFSAFNQIERAANLAKSEDFKAEDSTSVRTFMYLYGVNELFASNGLGIGVAGVGSKLASETNLFGEDKDIFSFHNFFLEMVVDIGVIPFVIIMLAYLKLAFSLIKESRYKIDSYMAKACGLSLLTIIPASIAPSSIIYVFTFWIVIGFSIATFLIIKENRYV